MIRAETIPPALTAGIGDTPFGKALIATDGKRLHQLAFVASRKEATITHEWPDTSIRWDDTVAQALLNRIFDRSHHKAHLELALHGTPFQLDVWQALLRIPFGNTMSYQQVAAMAGHPNAIRATASAIARNRIAFLIPCHRVIRSDGETGQYRWGAKRKQALLLWEQTKQAKGNP